MFKYEIVVEVSEDTSFKSIEELAEAIKMWRGVRNVTLKNASQHRVQADGATCACKLPGFDVGNLAICPTCHKPHRS